MKPLCLFLESLNRPGDWQMALDAVIFRRVEAGEMGPVLRLYTWSPWCVTLGNFQEPEDQVNAQRAARMGVDVVRRITGGRAVFHAQEVTYTLCASKQIAPWGKTLGDTYDWVAARLLEALRSVGFEGSLERAEHGPVERAAERRQVKPPCFSSASRSEVVWRGRKLVGSAQRRGRLAFLQHGSILLGLAHLNLVDMLEFSEWKKPLVRSELEQHSVSLSQIPGCVADERSVLDALRREFARFFDLRDWDIPDEIAGDVEKERLAVRCYSGKQKTT